MIIGETIRLRTQVINGSRLDVEMRDYLILEILNGVVCLQEVIPQSDIRNSLLWLKKEDVEKASVHLGI